jgi:hypothetical protein
MVKIKKRARRESASTTPPQRRSKRGKGTKTPQAKAPQKEGREKSGRNKNTPSKSKRGDTTTGLGIGKKSTERVKRRDTTTKKLGKQEVGKAERERVQQEEREKREKEKLEESENLKKGESPTESGANEIDLTQKRKRPRRGTFEFYTEISRQESLLEATSLTLLGNKQQANLRLTVLRRIVIELRLDKLGSYQKDRLELILERYKTETPTEEILEFVSKIEKKYLVGKENEQK